MHKGLFQIGAFPIGIDLGASGARLIQFARVGGRLKIIAAARIEAESDSPTDEGRFSSLQSVLERKIRAGDFRGRACVIGIDDRLLRVRSVRLPSMSDAEIEQSVRVDAASRLGFAKDESIEFGWTRAGQIQQGDETREEIILTGIRSEHAERIVDMAIGAGLDPIALEPNFIATSRAYARRRRRAADQEIAQVIVDLGRRSTNVIAMRGETLCFYKQIDWGSERLDRAAAERLDMDPSTVSEIRRQRLRNSASGGGDAPVDERVDRAIFDSVRPLLNEIAHEITLCVRYFLVTFRGSKPECILLSGGDATEPRLADIVTELSGVPTRIGRPIEGIDLGPTSLPMNRRGPLCEWATAAGLALRSDQRGARDGGSALSRLLTLPSWLRRAS